MSECKSKCGRKPLGKVRIHICITQATFSKLQKLCGKKKSTKARGVVVDDIFDRIRSRHPDAKEGFGPVLDTIFESIPIAGLEYLDLILTAKDKQVLGIR